MAIDVGSNEESNEFDPTDLGASPFQYSVKHRETFMAVGPLNQNESKENHLAIGFAPSSPYPCWNCDHRCDTHIVER